ncbi:unnamed protein product [Chrysoparadoxa australica]
MDGSPVFVLPDGRVVSPAGHISMTDTANPASLSFVRPKAKYPCRCKGLLHRGAIVVGTSRLLVSCRGASASGGNSSSDSTKCSDSEECSDSSKCSDSSGSLHLRAYRAEPRPLVRTCQSIQTSWQDWCALGYPPLQWMSHSQKARVAELAVLRLELVDHQAASAQEMRGSKEGGSSRVATQHQAGADEQPSLSQSYMQEQLSIKPPAKVSQAAGGTTMTSSIGAAAQTTVDAALAAAQTRVMMSSPEGRTHDLAHELAETLVTGALRTSVSTTAAIVSTSQSLSNSAVGTGLVSAVICKSQQQGTARGPHKLRVNFQPLALSVMRENGVKVSVTDKWQSMALRVEQPKGSSFEVVASVTDWQDSTGIGHLRWQQPSVRRYLAWWLAKQVHLSEQAHMQGSSRRVTFAREPIPFWKCKSGSRAGTSSA